MTSVLKNMRNFSKKKGKTADTPEGRQKAMMKLSPKEFRDRIDQLEKSIDNYLEKRPYPSKADRIERQQYLITLRHKLASYKKELTAIENGKPGFIHKPKIGLERKGNTISYSDLKKELLKFIFDMANKAREGRTFLRDYDPETYRIANPEGNQCPPEPEPKLAAFFDAMKDFKNIFLTDDKDNVPKISFDIIKEKVENVYKTGMIYKASLKGKNEDNVLKYYMNSMTDIWHDCLDNIDKLQPYMDMETPEGRIGSKNIYDVTKTMAPPYNKLLLVGSEFDMMTPQFINKQMSKQALDSWRESIDALDKEKLLQKRIKKTWSVRDRIILYDAGNAANNLYINPAGPELPPNVREERKKEMMKTVAKHIFCELADKEDMWTEISNTVTTDGNPVSRYLYEELADKVLENNQAFLNVHESSTYFNIGERFVAEAKRLGTFEQVKEAFNPAGIIQHIKVAEAEKNKTVETAPVNMKK